MPPPSSIRDFDVSRVPTELRNVPRWICWRYVPRKGKKPSKVPTDPSSGSNIDPLHGAGWMNLDAAVAACRASTGLDGVGFVFDGSDGYSGVDLDDCFDDQGTLSPEAAAIVEWFNTYAEVSPSGTGVKIFLKGCKPAGRKRCRAKGLPGIGEVEVYDRDRYFTVTSMALDGTPRTVEARQEQLHAFCTRLWPERKARGIATCASVGFEGDDQALIERAMSAVNGARFKALWSGGTSDYRGDDSAADLALCNMLAFWTGGDRVRMDRLFRASGLYRDKWEREDYRNLTIGKALECRTEYYRPSSPSRGRAKGFTGAPGDDPEHANVDAQPMSTLDPSPKGLPMTDLGNAERFERRAAARLRYCYANGRWHSWDQRRWRAGADGLEMRVASDTARAIVTEASALRGENRTAALKWAHTSESRARQEAMEVLARSRADLVVSEGSWDADPMALNVLNGTIDLRTGGLRAHRREDLITKLAPVMYDPAAECPRFSAFLERIFAGETALIEYVLRFFGMSLTADIREQIMPVFYGTGANGKSVLVDTVVLLMGDYATPAPPQLLVDSKYTEHATEIADLRGRRLVVASEIEGGAMLKVQRIKQLTGDVELKGRFMRQDFFTFRRTHKMILVANDRPSVQEQSEAIWRRLKLVPFRIVIPPEERDPQLLERLRAEWPGILARLVRGCLEWQSNGLGEPAPVSSATGEYRGDADSVGQFIHDACETDQGRDSTSEIVVPYSELWHAYKRWAAEAGAVSVSEHRFRTTLDGRGFKSATQRYQGKATKVRVGLRLAAPSVPGKALPP